MHQIFERASTFWAVCVTTVAIPVIDFLFGSHVMTKPLLTIFIILTAMDWIAGRYVAGQTGTKRSQYGLAGALRTAMMLLALILGNVVDGLLGYDLPIAFALVFAMIAVPTAESVIANIVLAGWDSHIKVEWVQRLIDTMSKWVESEILYKQKRIKERQKEKGGGPNEN